MILTTDENTGGYSVCSMARLSSFGEQTAVFGDVSGTPGDAVPFDIWKKQLLRLIREWDDKVKVSMSHYSWYDDETAYFPKLAVLMAVTGDGQTSTEQYLQELGFVRSGPYDKLKHNLTKISVWLVHVPELCKTLGYVSKYDPRTPEERGY